MEQTSEKRNDPRMSHKASVLIKDVKTGNLHKAQMMNYCTNGFYCVTDGHLKPGQEIHVAIENSPFLDFSEVSDCHLAKIIWSQQLDRDFNKFGYGVKIPHPSRKAKFTKTRL